MACTDTDTVPFDRYTRKIEDKINYFLRKIKDSIVCDADVFKRLFASGSATGVMYGLPKIHKPDFANKYQFRPIFAAYNNPCFQLAKFLVPVLEPLTTNEYTVDNSYTFVSSLKQFEGQADNLFMASFDVDNLYTNVPIYETIEIILNEFFTSSATVVIGLTRSLFKNILELAVLNSFFIFNGILYRQREGLGMGLPLSPSCANIFMCFKEKLWLDQCPIEFAPVFYKRYIDDTFVLFRCKSHAQKFHDYLNNCHNNIKFTMELESNDCLPFLDCNVSRDASNFMSSVYRKPTFSGQGISYFSYMPFRLKLNSIRTLLHRAYGVSSSFLSLHKEFLYLKNYFFNNGFPIHLIEHCIKKFLNDKYFRNDLPTLTNDTFHFSLPFFGPQSETMGEELVAVLSRIFPSIKFICILTNKNTIGSFFNYKDRLRKCLRASVVYKFVCPRCGSQYVGSSSRTDR